jgi:dTDP-4-amino-4,6-dideoxygalactose transaminase
MGLNSRRLPIAEQQATELITIPIHQYLNKTHMDLVSELIHKFYKDEV